MQFGRALYGTLRYGEVRTQVVVLPGWVQCPIPYSTFEAVATAGGLATFLRAVTPDSLTISPCTVAGGSFEGVPDILSTFEIGEPPVEIMPSEEREYLADFATETHEIQGPLSLTRRPDTISFDYLTAFSPGPVAISDPSLGLHVRPWRLRVAGDDLVLDEDLGGTWVENLRWGGILAGLDVSEITLGFAQNGDPMFAVEASGNLWVYFFDATIPDWVFVNFGAGRSPRMALDQPINTGQSDVQVFYVADGELRHRQQRDRFATEYPVVPVGDGYVEWAGLREDGRLEVVVATRDPATGRYSLGSQLTPIPPRLLDTEALDVTHLFTSIGLRVVLLDYTLEAEALDVQHEFASIQLRTLIIEIPLQESLDVDHTFATVELRVVIIAPTMEAEALDVDHTFASVALLFNVIPRVMDTESLDVDHTFASITLGAP